MLWKDGDKMSNKTISLKMMGEFSISVNGQETATLVAKTRKGVALIEYLILNWGKQVPKQRLMRILWSDYLHANPESALKTLVSRLRKTLNEICDGLGECVASQRGCYYFESLPGMHIDVLEIMQIFENLPREKDEERRRTLYKQLLRLYTGDLFLTGDLEGGEGYHAALHNEYLNAVYDYIELLLEHEEYNQIVEVCKKARKIDQFDERLNMEMMQAQVEANHLEDAMEEYRRVTDLNRKHLDVEPSEEMRKFYEKMIRSGNTLKFNLEAARTQLSVDEEILHGAHVCGYEEFRQIYSLLAPTLKRLGCNMFLGLISLQDQDEEDESTQDAALQRQQMNSLLDILRENLRRGDVVMQYSPTMAMLLLPTVNYTTGNMIMERIRYQFLESNPGSKSAFRYRLGELK